MLFSSPVFFLFFALYLIAHLLLPIRFRMPLIIIGSTVYYGFWNPLYVWVPFLLFVMAYLGAIWLDAAGSARNRKIRTIITVVFILSPLAFYKYTNFFYSKVLGLFTNWSGELIDYGLPLGISFVSFTMVSYVVDVYKGKFPVERRLSMMAGYTLFFPQLIAGPILRPDELIPQLDKHKRAFDAKFILGTVIFTLGLVKKLVFADTLAEVVDSVYSGLHITSGWDYLVAFYGYSLQIYCDFSGYTDMAIGSSLILGVDLPANFLRPYTASSIVEFWRRWHVTLSRWLKDYLYIPLGGNRFGFAKQMRNLIITMGLGGLWHGANWTFVIWGLMHGMGIAVVHFISRSPAVNLVSRIPRFVKILVTFHFVTFLWVFFRAQGLNGVWQFFSGMFTTSYSNIAAFVSNQAFLVLILVVFFSTHAFDDHERIARLLPRLNPVIMWTCIVLAWVMAIAISTGSSAKFIYFDF